MGRCNLKKQCVFFAMRDEGTELHEYFTRLYCAAELSGQEIAY